MGIPTGVDMQVKTKKQSAKGTVATSGSSQLLRRVKSTLELTKKVYESNEMRPDRMDADERHGTKSVAGNISGELSPGTYEEYMASFVRRDFTAVTALTGLELTITGSGPWVIQRSAGSFISGNIKLGHVFRLSVGTLNAANINKNLLVVAMDADELTVVPVNGVALVAEGPISTCTLTVVGKVSFCPTSGHTEDYHSIEHFYPTMTPDNSEVFWDCVINEMKVGIRPDGMIGIDFGVMGLDQNVDDAEYFTSPTAISSSRLLTGASGVLRTASGALAGISGISIDGTNNAAFAPSEGQVGSDKYADIVKGRHRVTGQITALFDSVALRDAFLQETELSLYAVFPTTSDAAADFVAFTIDRLKVNGATRDDGEGAKMITIPFRALLNTAGGSGTTSEQTILRIQDSLA